MTDKSKSIWRRRWFVSLLVLFSLGVFCASLTSLKSDEVGSLLLLSLGIALGLTALVGMVTWSLRWLHRRLKLKQLVLVLISLATLIALAYAVENLRGKRAWDKYRQAAEARGQDLDYFKFVPPPVPDEQNFAMHPIWVEHISSLLPERRSQSWYGEAGAALRRTNGSLPLDFVLTLRAERLENTIEADDWRSGGKLDLTVWQSYYRWLADNTNFFPSSPEALTPAAEVLLALSKYQDAIDKLHAAARRPESRFPISYDDDDPAGILLPHLATIKNMTKCLSLRAVAELDATEPEHALQDLKLMLRLNESIRIEPFLISHLVHLAMFQIELQPIWEGLADRRWTDTQLESLDTRLASLDFLADYQHVSDCEPAWECHWLDFAERHRTMLANNFGWGDYFQYPPQANFLEIFAAHAIPRGWFYGNKLTLCRITDGYARQVIDLKSRTYPSLNLDEAEVAFQRQLNHRGPYTFFSGFMLSDFGKAARKFVVAQSSLDLARLAIALERHRLASGNYPETLEALTPRFIADIPHDVIKGGPLHYQRSPDGSFVLYSVGFNETDDGGAVVMNTDKPREVDLDRGDWVWPSAPELRTAKGSSPIKSGDLH